MRNWCVCVLMLAALIAGCAHDHDHEHEVPEGDVSAILALSGDATNGETLFADSCGNASCHGSDGVSGPAPDIADYLTVHPVEHLARTVRFGTGAMPALSNLSDQDVADVIAYLESL